MATPPDNDDALRRASERVAALRARLEAAEGAAVRLVETHLSWVLLAPRDAYKLKKPRRLPLLDFSTPAARRHFCEEEVRLNRLAPTLYLGVLDVRDSPDGPAFGGEGPVLDAAVHMRRFPDGALWSEMQAAGQLQATHIDAMAALLSRCHRDAPAAPADAPFGSSAVHADVTRNLAASLDATPEARAFAPWPLLREWLLAQLDVLAPLWEARKQAGRVRECHGDLHLANVLQLDGQACAFDCIEFDDKLRWIDVLDDTAFLVMDLLAHGDRALAYRFLDAMLEASGDHDALPTLRFYLVRRALVRAWAASMAARAAQARRYLDLAASLSRSANARLAITHGLPGSGKSMASRAFVEQAGAIRVRSDVERKRFFGLDALEPSQQRVPGGIYDRATTERTYARLLQVARTALESGWPVVVDAAFLRRSERAAFEALARSMGVPWSIIDCRAPMDVLRERVRARGPDASEADVAVLERLSSFDEPLDEAELRSIEPLQSG